MHGSYFAAFLLGALILLAAHGSVRAESDVVTKTIEYKHGDVVLEGYLAYPKDLQGKHAAVLVVPDWMGLKERYQEVARDLAKLGYVAFAVDMYGKGIRPDNPKDASAQAGKYKGDRPLLRARIAAGLKTLCEQEHTDSGKVAAIGYCFGGTTVLELARSGADVAGVVSFHGGLDSPTPDDAKNIKAKVLALHGADDPFVKPAEVAAFQDEMRAAKVDWQFVSYANAVHSFTHPGAGNDNSKGAAYNEKAAKRSWQAMRDFFTELFEAK